MKFNIKYIDNFRHLFKPPIFSIGIFLLGLLTFSGAFYYHFASQRKSEPHQENDQSSLSSSIEGIQSETNQIPEVVSNSPTPTAANKTTNNRSTQTPTPTTMPNETKEVHTKETVEVKTVVVNTATPTVTPTITSSPMPTATPTPDNRPFEASMSNSENTYTITGNKILQSCQTVESTATGNLTVSGSGQISGNVCAVQRGNPSWPYFSVKVVSVYNDEKILGNAPPNYW